MTLDFSTTPYPTCCINAVVLSWEYALYHYSLPGANKRPRLESCGGVSHPDVLTLTAGYGACSYELGKQSWAALIVTSIPLAVPTPLMI